MSTDGSFDHASLPTENVTRNKDKQQYVVHKAWKLLKSAMSMQQAEKQHQASKVVSRTLLRKIGSSSKSKNHTASKSLPSKFKNQGSTRLKMCGDTSGGSMCERSKKKQHGSKREYGAVAPTNDLVLSSSEPQKQFLANIHHEQASIESDGEVNRVSSHTRFRFDEFPGLRTSTGLMGKFTSNPSKLQRTSLPSTNAEYPEAVEKGHQTCSDINSRQDGGPKAEIQSLVKLNLKILTRGKRLGANEFKDVARRSTHAILEARGLKPQESGKHAVIPSICSHNKGTEPPAAFMAGLEWCWVEAGST
ncbi:hypothetical protein AKJ16_DCAP05103 [Drosera capensis]